MQSAYYVANQFDKLYQTVFNPDNSIKPCGRNTTRKLIEFANYHFSKSEIADSYGNEETGYIYVDDMIRLHDKLMRGDGNGSSTN